jgi:hypothetical protein
VGYASTQARDAGLFQFEENNDHSISISGAVNSVTAGDLSLATIQDNQLEAFATQDTFESAQGDMSGYSVTSARGNLTAGTISPVTSNDYLGYFAAHTFTGNDNINNTFQRTAAIGFYATGSDVNYGLGGNISFWTKPDGTQTLNQAMSIDNNSRVKFFSNVILHNPGTPITAATPGIPGEMFVHGNDLYVCVEEFGDNRWRKVALQII